jgi:hypothetical protein
VYGGVITDIYWSPSGDKLSLEVTDASGKKNILINDNDGNIIDLRSLFPNPNNIPADVFSSSWSEDDDKVSFQHVPGSLSIQETNSSSRKTTNNISGYTYSISNKSIIHNTPK